MKRPIIRFNRYYLFPILSLFLIFFVLTLSGCGGGGSSSGPVIYTYVAGAGPFGNAIDSAGNVWVANGFNGTVTELNSSGAVIGTNTYLAGNLPETVAVDSAGNIWVANKGNATGTPGTAPGDSNVMELNSSGAIIATYGYGNQPYSIAIDKSGNVWVTDFGNGTAGTDSLDSNVQEYMGAANGPEYFPYSGPMWPCAQ
ncbi:MAG: NHL repeat-containing protein [bacterium]